MCHRSLNSFKSFWNHIRDFHEITGPSARIDCPLCLMTFTNINNLRKHVQAKICPKLLSQFSFPKITNNLNDENILSQESFFSHDYSAKIINEVTNDYKLSFMRSLQMSGSIPLVKSGEILCAANSLVNSIVDIAKTFLQPNLSHDEIIIKLNSLKEPFPKQTSSQYQIEKYLEKTKIFIEAQELRLGSHFKFDNSVGAMREKFDNMYYFRISDILPVALKKYREVTDAGGRLNQDKNIIRDYQSGEFVSSFTGNPLFIQIYYDDIEICNPLGAKAKIHKLGMFYFIISNFAPHLKSQLSAIFPLLIVKSKYIKSYGMNSILAPIVNELNKLNKSMPKSEEFENSPFSNVQLLQVCGDNLALHAILGFSESFNANFRCRFCKATKSQSYVDVEERKELIRNRLGYSEDVEVQNVSLTGIKELSIINQIAGFHVTSNFAPDIMHDIFEGICIIELKLVLEHILQNNYFSLVEINHRLSCCLKRNGHHLTKFPEIGSNIIDGDKKSCFSASEMSNFFLVFPAVFGDRIPSDDKYWNLILKFRRIIRIVMAPVITRSKLLLLQFLIAEHHQMYIDLTGNNLTPKFHHLLHYPNAINQLGPLRNYWCMRFEAKHRFAKTVGKNSCNFKNISKSVARRMSLNMAFSLGSINIEPKVQLSIGPGNTFDIRDIKDDVDFSTISSAQCNKIFCLDFVQINGTKISPLNYFLIGSSESGLQFCQVILCFVHDESVKLAVARIQYVEKFQYSYIFKVGKKDKAEILDPLQLDLQNPLVVVRSFDECDSVDNICCPIELI